MSEFLRKLHSRMSAEQLQKLDELEASHYLSRCSLVEAMREEERPGDWYDRRKYEGGPRYSAHSQSEVVVSGGFAMRPDGVAREWVAVSGEIRARR